MNIIFSQFQLVDNPHPYLSAWVWQPRYWTCPASQISWSPQVELSQSLSGSTRMFSRTMTPREQNILRKQFQRLSQFICTITSINILVMVQNQIRMQALYGGYKKQKIRVTLKLAIKLNYIQCEFSRIYRKKCPTGNRKKFGSLQFSYFRPCTKDGKVLEKSPAPRESSSKLYLYIFFISEPGIHSFGRFPPKKPQGITCFYLIRWQIFQVLDLSDKP